MVSGISGGTMCLLLRGQNSLSDISLLAVGHIPTGHQNSPDISPQGQIYRSPNSKFYSAPRTDNDKICELLAERNLLLLSWSGNHSQGFPRFVHHVN